MEIINVPGRYAIKLYVEKESGNLHVRNIDMGVHMPLMYAVYSADREPLCLRDYMNIREIRLIEAVKELEASNAVLLGNSFNIGFFCKEDSDKFKEILCSPTVTKIELLEEVVAQELLGGIRL